MKQADKAIVLLSGGIDSAVALWWAKRKGWKLHTITFNYYQRHAKEILAAENLAKATEVVEHKVVNVPFLKDIADSALLGEASLSTQIKGRPAVYVPARNIVFYGAAASWAETIEARWIVGGHNRGDAKFFPDASERYFRLFNRTLKIGTWIGKKRPIRILTPLSKMSKVQIVKLAAKLSVPLHLTWSCYQGGEKACGVCDACKARLRAFQRAGLKDPLEYQSL